MIKRVLNSFLLNVIKIRKCILHLSGTFMTANLVQINYFSHSLQKRLADVQLINYCKIYRFLFLYLGRGKMFYGARLGRRLEVKDEEALLFIFSGERH